LRVPQTTKQSLLATNVGKCSYVAEAANAIGSTIVGSSFSGSLTLVEMGHIRIGSAGNGLIRSPGSGSSLSHRLFARSRVQARRIGDRQIQFLALNQRGGMP
jgi:hypothetical protein